MTSSPIPELLRAYDEARAALPPDDAEFWQQTYWRITALVRAADAMRKARRVRGVDLPVADALRGAPLPQPTPNVLTGAETQWIALALVNKVINAVGEVQLIGVLPNDVRASIASQVHAQVESIFSHLAEYRRSTSRLGSAFPHACPTCKGILRQPPNQWVMEWAECERCGTGLTRMGYEQLVAGALPQQTTEKKP